jgi:hypothetical protein
VTDVKTKRTYRKKSSYWEERKSSVSPQSIEKASNMDMSTSRLRLGEIGSTALSTIKLYADWRKPYDLKWPECIRTYNEMEYDDDVATALDASYTFVERAFVEPEVVYNKESEVSIEAARFLKWCLNNMDDGMTLRSAVRSAITFKKYGFSVLEKCYTQVTSGEYAGMYKLQKLATRPQETLNKANPYVYSDDGRTVIGIIQSINAVSSTNAIIPASIVGDRFLPRKKLLIFGYNSTDSNPFGVSPLASIYQDWKEKVLISDYEVVGVSKDLGGKLRAASL